MQKHTRKSLGGQGTSGIRTITRCCHWRRCGNTVSDFYSIFWRYHSEGDRCMHARPVVGIPARGLRPHLSRLSHTSIGYGSEHVHCTHVPRHTRCTHTLEKQLQCLLRFTTDLMSRPAQNMDCMRQNIPPCDSNRWWFSAFVTTSVQKDLVRIAVELRDCFFNETIVPNWMISHR